MMSRMSILLMIVAALVLVSGCSDEPQMTAPGGGTEYHAKDGTETLGVPSIPIAAGSGIAEGGVGMVGVTSGQLTVEVPVGATVVQAIAYWAGGSTTDRGNETISMNGTSVTGALIGGPVNFFGDYDFYAYRADITDLGLVAAGSNVITVADFDFTGTTLNENNGASVLVVYDDGSEAAITLFDGLDMAYFGFEPTLDATVPQVFSVEPANLDRTAQLTIVAASVGENRPSVIKVSTSAGDQFYDNYLGSFDGLTWDSLTFEVDVPAGVDEVSVQIISTDSTDPQGASLGWVAAGLTIAPASAETFIASGVVFEDASVDAFYDGIEWGIGGVVVELRDGSGLVATSTTDFYGVYSFDVPAGDYTVEIDLTGYPDDFNANLNSYFDSTTPLSVPVTAGPADTGTFFGFTPRAEELALEVASGALPSNGRDGKYWKTLFRRAIIEDESNRQANGHNGDDGGDNNGQGWGHGENYASGDDLLGFVAMIEGYYLETPYQFSDGMEFREVYDILASKPQDDEGKLFRELLITELNFAAGYGLIGEEDVLGVLISWGESLLAAGDAKSLDKARSGDIIFALQMFAVINTGGGGGVDE